MEFIIHEEIKYMTIPQAKDRQESGNGNVLL